MKKEEYKVVEFEDDTKWFIASEITYNDEKYQYLASVNDKEDEFTDEYKVMKISTEGDDTYYDLVEDAETLKIVVPLLMPEAKEYIDNPDKLQELAES